MTYSEGVWFGLILGYIIGVVCGILMVRLTRHEGDEGRPDRRPSAQHDREAAGRKRRMGAYRPSGSRRGD